MSILTQERRNVLEAVRQVAALGASVTASHLELLTVCHDHLTPEMVAALEKQGLDPLAPLDTETVIGQLLAEYSEVALHYLDGDQRVAVAKKVGLTVTAQILSEELGEATISTNLGGGRVLVVYLQVHEPEGSTDEPAAAAQDSV